MQIEVGKCANLYGCAKAKDYSINSPHQLLKIKLDTKESVSRECFFQSLAQYYLGKGFTESEYLDFKTSSLNINIPIPVCLKDIAKFERQNAHLEVNINVFGDSGGYDIEPLHLSKGPHKEVINLLLIHVQGGLTQEAVGHYMLINNLGKFVRKRYPKVYGRGYSYTGEVSICYNCLTGFSSEASLKEHKFYCMRQEPQLTLPPDEDEISFKNWNNKFPFQVTGFFDFECVSIPCGEGRVEQKAISFSLIFVTKEGKLLSQHNYFGEDAAEVFLEKLFSVEAELIKFMKINVPMKWGEMSQEFKDKFMSPAAVCHICEQEFKEGEIRVRDHEHSNGMPYSSPSHQSCNLNRPVDKRIPLFAHNGNSYDMHLIIKLLNLEGKDWQNRKIKKMNFLPKNTEKFTAVYLNSYVFLDSMQFLPSSLEQLTNTLVSSGCKFEYLAQSKLYSTDAERELLLRKGVMCYEYLKSRSQLKSSGYPAHKEFFSSLKGENVSLEDYLHGKQVYETFSCKSMIDYVMLYNVLDVFLLCECMMDFRKLALEEFKLDPFRYVSLPAFTLDAFLYKTRAKIGLIKDLEMLLLIENSIRGGLSFVAERYAKETREMSDEEFFSMSKEEQKSTCKLLYLDQNNLYGLQQTRLLPVRNFKFLTRDEINSIDWENTSETSPTGYFLEVDLAYDRNHRKHRSFPIAPEQRQFTAADLSEHAKFCFSKSRKNVDTYKSEKLITSFESKEKYFLHYINLKTYLRLGMKLKKIHRVISFEQSPIMKDYIEHCTRMRKESKTESGKMLWKLAVNALFGKTIESKRKYLKCTAHTSASSFKRSMNGVFFENFKVVHENLVFTFAKYHTVIMDKPIQLGFSILELSKDTMIRAYYEQVLPRLPLNTRILFSDTDSLCLRTSAPSLDFCLRKLEDIMDFSNYDPSHPLYSQSRKNQLGYFKDECKGDRLTEFVGIRSKVYSLKTEKYSRNTCKGISKPAKKKLTFNAFKKCLRDNSVVRVKQCNIRSKNHVLTLEDQEKLAFSAADDKRYLLPCSIHSVPYGYKYLSQEMSQCSLCLEMINSKKYM